MTKIERERVSELVRATEYMFHENLALKLILEYREVQNWQKLLSRMMEDKEIKAGVHLRFRDIYRELKRSDDPTDALQYAASGLPSPFRPN